MGLSDRAKMVQENFESRQTSTEEALEELTALVRKHEEQKKEQARRGFSAVQFFILGKLRDVGIANPDQASKEINAAMEHLPNWRAGDRELRKFRKQVTFAIFRQEDDIDKVTRTVDEIFDTLMRENHG